MPDVPGTIIRNSPNRITALFVIDDIQYQFSATVSPSIQPFSSKLATLEYSSPEQLTSTRSYHGKIGTNTLQLNVDNGPTVRGELNLPGVVPASTVDGAGAWEMN